LFPSVEKVATTKLKQLRCCYSMMHARNKLLQIHDVIDHAKVNGQTCARVWCGVFVACTIREHLASSAGAMPKAWHPGGAGRDLC
jgi:hypothetical protein